MSKKKMTLVRPNGFRTIEDLAVMTQKGFTGLRTEMNDRFGEVNERFDAVDKRFDGVDQRLNRIGSNLKCKYQSEK